MSPALRPVYDDRSTAMVVMVVIICVLVLLTIIFLCLWLSSRSRNAQNAQNTQTVDLKNVEFSESEIQLLNEYKKLDNQSKELVKNTIHTLNTKN